MTDQLIDGIPYGDRAVVSPKTTLLNRILERNEEGWTWQALILNAIYGALIPVSFPVQHFFFVLGDVPMDGLISSVYSLRTDVNIKLKKHPLRCQLMSRAM